MQAGDDAGQGLGSPAILDWLKPLESVGVAKRTGPEHVGGKASTLGRLVREGFPVPRGWVIPARHFTRFVEETLPRGHDLAALVKLADTRAGVERAARAQDRVLAQPLPDGLRASIEALWKNVEAEAPWGLAARSSGTCEDDEATSFAGLATSDLGLRGPEAIELGVRRVWASAFSPRALLYLARAGVRSYAMAVVLQLMVRADAAGVLFTAPPPGLEGDGFEKDERLAYVTRGLGAPVVDGAVAADVVRLSKGGAVVSQIVAEKKTALVVGAHGLEAITLGEAEARAPALDADAIADLGGLATDLETSLGHALDVEFAVEAAVAPGQRADGERPRVWVLQARPLTGGGYPDGGDADTVWSRTNLGEALPGPATPLTWSIASAFADHGFREAFGALGCHVPRSAKLVANVHGRFYLNLTAFMRIAAQVPGLTPRALLSASGGATEAMIARLEAQAEGVSKRGFVMRLPLSGPREIARQARLEGEVAAYEQEAERSRRVLLDLDLSLLPDDALTTTLKSAQQLLDRTGGLMLACASASLAAHLALCR
ncbi:MAG TPA: PEP/pyruvate-binding domain-containing protein, partial [Byssovorax sp.]